MEMCDVGTEPPFRDRGSNWNSIRQNDISNDLTPQCQGSNTERMDTQTAMKIGLTLAQRRDDSTDVGPTLDQPALLSG